MRQTLYFLLVLMMHEAYVATDRCRDRKNAAKFAAAHANIPGVILHSCFVIVAAIHGSVRQVSVFCRWTRFARSPLPSKPTWCETAIQWIWSDRHSASELKQRAALVRRHASLSRDPATREALKRGASLIENAATSKSWVVRNDKALTAVPNK